MPRDSVPRRLAHVPPGLDRRYLTDRSLTTSQIAYLLAYDDTNSFYRAFRRWTGLTPEAAR